MHAPNVLRVRADEATIHASRLMGSLGEPDICNCAVDRVWAVGSEPQGLDCRYIDRCCPFHWDLRALGLVLVTKQKEELLMEMTERETPDGGIRAIIIRRCCVHRAWLSQHSPDRALWRCPRPAGGLCTPECCGRTNLSALAELTDPGSETSRSSHQKRTR